MALCSPLFVFYAAFAITSSFNSLALDSRLPYIAESKFYESTRLICKTSRTYVLKIIEVIEERYDEFANSRKEHGSFQQAGRQDLKR
jgi:hypothetical protein